ncbi:putative ribonuclease H-like domain-containing protein [Tanacetum coccineum]|uniref:Ribonuclease H-like domain-containing protein n=1 Tax=Tanacetum coccineum TaxID=301880 RepID=A0ABQ4WH09_9ASTR
MRGCVFNKGLFRVFHAILSIVGITVDFTWGSDFVYLDRLCQSKIEILHDVVGTSGYHCGVLLSFSVERIKQGIGPYDTYDACGYNTKRDHTAIQGGTYLRFALKLILRCNCIVKDYSWEFRFHRAKVVKIIINPDLSICSSLPIKHFPAIMSFFFLELDVFFHSKARIRRIFLDGYGVLVFRIVIFKISSFKLQNMDVKSAFLYGKIEEDVYVCQPPGFEDPDFLDRVYKVEKALYGLHQAPRAWYETLLTYLLDNRFQRGNIDKNLIIRRDKGDILLVQVYVDDIIFGSTKKELCNVFEKLMHEKF